MAFKAAFLAHAPDGNPEKNRSVIETPLYKLFVTVVRNQDQAISECKRLAKDEGIQSVMLCPGFTSENVADLSRALDGKIGVFVARGDGPSTRASMEIMAKEGWFAFAQRQQ